MCHAVYHWNQEETLYPFLGSKFAYVFSDRCHRGVFFLVGCSVVGNDQVGVVAKFIDDALDVFGGLKVLEIDMR